ncbi:acetyl-CoA synthetase-like protein [Peniophora sp. CONT]|nr:acetyl-CoA synthetase-like protein [Peniophora sp. CONT]
MTLPYPVSTLQGANDPTFKRPPLDGSLTIPELYIHQAQHTPDRPLYVYADAERALQTIRYRDAALAIDHAAAIVLDHADALKAKRGEGGNGRMTFGILAVADTITYSATMLAIMRCGHTVFCISTRNSAAAVAHLARATGAFQLFVSPDHAMQHLVHEASEMLKQDGLNLDALPIPQFDQVYFKDSVSSLDEGRLRRPSADDPVLILHSSGSTAFPKPIYSNTKQFLEYGTTPYFGEIDWCGYRIAMHSLPMFHIMAASSVAWAPCTGVILGCFHPASPPVFPTSGIFLEDINITQSDIVVTVPAFIEEWSREAENLPALQRVKQIVYGGAPMNKAIGNELAKAGVRLTPGYGMTEVGYATMVLPADIAPQDWEYFKLSLHTRPSFVPYEGKMSELFFVQSETHHPCVLDATIDGKPACETKDLLEQHPTRPELWKVFGRADDQIVLSTGEKTNPVPLEAIMRTDPNIAVVIMFGRGRFQNGVLIQPSIPVNPSDEGELIAYRNLIWDTVEKANAHAPSHSTIFKEMILVASPEKPVELTAKGTPRRQVTLAAYSREIEELYETVKNASQTDMESPAEWTEQATLDFIRGAVGRVMRDAVEDDDDLFQFGCDSLQATMVRNTIMHALRETVKQPVHSLPINFIYEHPTVAALASFVYHWALTGGESGSRPNSEKALKVAEMEQLLEQFTQYLNERSPQKDASANGYHSSPNEEVVVITGTTGYLGSFLLEQTIRDPRVRKVYALNRYSSASGVTLVDRQRDAFRSLGIDPVLLDNSKVEFVAADYPRERLGLVADKYEEIRASATTIIHNAWRVDFNLALASFKPLIKGLCNMIELALGSTRSTGPHFAFVSSIGAVQGRTATDAVPEAALDDPLSAAGGGYGESKWVAEHLVLYARSRLGLNGLIARTGQLSGDLRSGAWNSKEWFPALVSASAKMGILPERDEDVAWLPMDQAASTLLDFTRSSSPTAVLHLMTPRPVPWSKVISAVSARLDLPTVSWDEWLQRYRARATSGKETDRAFNLAVFFEAFDKNGPNHAHYITKESALASDTLATLKPLAEEDIERYLTFWRREGLF